MVQLSFKGNSLLLPLYALDLKADMMQISILVALYSMMPVICSTALGRLCDRIDNEIPIYIGTACCGISLGIPAVMSGSLLFIAASQLLFGFGHVIFQLSMQNLLGKTGSDVERTKRFGMLSIVMSIGNIVSPLIIGRLIGISGYRISYGLCCVFSLVAFLLTLFMFLDQSKNRVINKLKFAKEKEFILFSVDLLRHREIQKVLMTSATIMTGTTLFSMYIPLYGSYLGYSSSSIGFFSSIYAVAFFLVRISSPVLLKTFTIKQTLMGALLLAGISYILLPLTNDTIGILGVCFLIGLGLGCGYPITMNMAYSAAPSGRSGEVLGMRLMANRLTQLLIPAFTGVLNLSISGVFIMLGIFLIGSSTACLNISKSDKYKNY